MDASQSQSGILRTAQCCHLLALGVDDGTRGLASEKVSKRVSNVLQLQATGPVVCKKGRYAIDPL